MISRVRRPKSRVACLKCCRKHHGGRYAERFRFAQVEGPGEPAAARGIGREETQKEQKRDEEAVGGNWKVLAPFFCRFSGGLGGWLLRGMRR